MLTANLHFFRCFLNPSTGFIWAFIAPVMVIFLVNCGFYTMAITIMCKQQRRLKKTNLTILKYTFFCTLL